MPMQGMSPVRHEAGSKVSELRMASTWYVTFELPRTLKHRRSPRMTRKFQTETEAKDFARMKFAEGLIVNAGTINPVAPR
jgi:hypothetical protein